MAQNVITELNRTGSPLNLQDVKPRFLSPDGREKDPFVQDFKKGKMRDLDIRAKLEKAGCDRQGAEKAIQIMHGYINRGVLTPGSVGFSVVHIDNVPAVVVSGVPKDPSQYKAEKFMGTAVWGRTGLQGSDLHLYKTADGHIHERMSADGPHRAARS